MGMGHPQQIEGDMQMRTKRPWVRSERLKARRGMRPSGFRRELKRQARRLMRRLFGRMGEDAPQRVPYCGTEW